MRFTLNERTPDQLELGIIYGGIVLLAVLIARFVPETATLIPLCAFRAFAGISCPTCGTTRSLFLIASGAVGDAFLMNPLVTVGVLFSLLYAVFGAMALCSGWRRPGLVLSPTEQDLTRSACLATFLINWGYLILTASSP